MRTPGQQTYHSHGIAGKNRCLDSTPEDILCFGICVLFSDDVTRTSHKDQTFYFSIFLGKS